MTSRGRSRSDPFAYANFADAALLNGEMDISETMYLLAIDVAGNDAAFYDWWGNTLLYNSREGAEEKFAEAARLDADNPEILLNWAEALSLRTDHDKAIELLKRAEGLDTDSPRLHALWGASLYAKKEQPAAEDRFRKALAAAAENGGDVLAEWRRVLVANDLFEDALAAYPMDGRDPEAIYALWKAAYREKTTDGAAILCDKLSLFGLDFFETLSGLDAAYFSEQISDLVDHCFADRSEP